MQYNNQVLDNLIEIRYARSMIFNKYSKTMLAWIIKNTAAGVCASEGYLTPHRLDDLAWIVRVHRDFDNLPKKNFAMVEAIANEILVCNIIDPERSNIHRINYPGRHAGQLSETGMLALDHLAASIVPRMLGATDRTEPLHQHWGGVTDNGDYPWWADKNFNPNKEEKQFLLKRMWLFSQAVNRSGPWVYFKWHDTSFEEKRDQLRVIGPHIAVKIQALEASKTKWLEAMKTHSSTLVQAEINYIDAELARIRPLHADLFRIL